MNEPSPQKNQHRSKYALVTGAGARVGRAIALELARHGFYIIVHYHQNRVGAQETLEHVKAMGGAGQIAQANLGDEMQRQALISTTQQACPTLDVLVNNASLFEPKAFAELKLSDWQSMFEVNVVAPYILSQGLLPQLKANQGLIVNLCDIGAERPLKGYTHYSSSKAALVGLTRSLAVELAPHIRCIGISPGQVAWPPDFSEAQKSKIIQRIPMARSGSPEDIARLLRFVLLEGHYLNGAVIPVDGGLSCRY